MTFTLDAIRVLQNHAIVKDDTTALIIANISGETIVFSRFSIDGREDHFLGPNFVCPGDIFTVNINQASQFGWSEGDVIEWNLDYGAADSILIIKKV
jgi:hypothetical protein